MICALRFEISGLVRRKKSPAIEPFSTEFDVSLCNIRVDKSCHAGIHTLCDSFSHSHDVSGGDGLGRGPSPSSDPFLLMFSPTQIGKGARNGKAPSFVGNGS